MIQNNHWWKMEQIAERLSCSEGTVKGDITFFRLSFLSELRFETSKQNGVRLIVLDSFYIESFYQRIMRECLNVQFLNLLFSETHNTLEEFAEALYTSPSSVKRCIEHVREVLKNYNLDIQQKPIRIMGSEKDVLFFFGVFFWEEYGSSFLKLAHTYKQEASKLVIEFKEKMELSLSTSLISKITLWIILYFERLTQGHHVEKNYQTLIPVSKRIKDFMIEATSQMPLETTDEDINFISFILESRYMYFNREEIQTHPDLLEVYNEIDDFLETVSKETSFILPNKSLLKKRLFSQYIYTLEFTGLNFLLVDRNRLTTLNSEGTYNCFIETVQFLLNDSKHTAWRKAVLSNTADFYYLLISTWENLTSEIYKKRSKINTLIISQFGLHHEMYLKELIHLRFPYTFNSFLLTEENFIENDIDLIITDHEVAEIKFQLNDAVPVIGVNYSPNNRNWNHLKELIETIFVQKQVETSD